jgi:hypothetical protein
MPCVMKGELTLSSDTSCIIDSRIESFGEYTIIQQIGSKLRDLECSVVFHDFILRTEAARVNQLLPSMWESLEGQGYIVKSKYNALA